MRQEISTRFTKAAAFNQLVLNLEPRTPGLQSMEECKLSVHQLKEEADELMDAAMNDDYVGCIDAVIDSLYFAYGILYKLGLNEEDVDALYSIVHNANLQKKLGIKANRPGFDAADAIKENGWQAPEEQMKDYIHSICIG